MTMKKRPGLTCEPEGYITVGEQLSYDKRDAFLYEVRDRGLTVGFITADRALHHPSGARWKVSRYRDDEIQRLGGSYATVEEALAAFQTELRRLKSKPIK